MSTANDIIQQCIARLSMVGGTSVQKYAEDKLFYMVKEKYTILFEEQFWKRHSLWQKFTLDGSSGTIIENVSQYFKLLSDVQVVSISNNSAPLTMLSPIVIPDEVLGSVPKFYAQHENVDKVIKILPITSVGNIFIRYRKRKEISAATDEVDFDDLCIVYAVCADYLSDDGDQLNSQKFGALFEQRLNKLKALDNTGVTSFDVFSGPSTAWG